LSENLGVLRRDAAADEIKALDQTARAQLRQYGVRFGAFNIYIPALLKPAAADLLLLLWALHAGRDHGLDCDSLPARPKQGLTSVEASDSVPEPYWRAAGFHVAGTRAVRIDMLERLSDLIRARIAFRAAEGGGTAPTGATGDGGFRVVSELMSVVGCSGEEFASILKALGFRRERRRLAQVAKAAAQAPAVAVALEGQEAAGREAPDAPPQAVEFEDIWRPGKRKEAHQAKHDSHKSRRQQKAPPARRDQHRPAARAKPERTAIENSPFAALEGLRRSLAARQPKGS
jgi:ATP-dependent RNA helicase SUPV3L1/SUV3